MSKKKKIKAKIYKFFRPFLYFYINWKFRHFLHFCVRWKLIEIIESEKKITDTFLRNAILKPEEMAEMMKNEAKQEVLKRLAENNFIKIRHKYEQDYGGIHHYRAELVILRGVIVTKRD